MARIRRPNPKSPQRRQPTRTSVPTSGPGFILVGDPSSTRITPHPIDPNENPVVRRDLRNARKGVERKGLADGFSHEFIDGDPPDFLFLAVDHHLDRVPPVLTNSRHVRATVRVRAKDIES